MALLTRLRYPSAMTVDRAKWHRAQAVRLRAITKDGHAPLRSQVEQLRRRLSRGSVVNDVASPLVMTGDLRGCVTASDHFAACPGFSLQNRADSGGIGSG